MKPIEAILDNRILGVAILSMLVAQVMKFLLVCIREHRFSYSRLFGTGGMPSGHSAFVTSLAFAIGYQVGFETAFFALALVFALIVMYDAAGVRRAAGKQAAIVNRIIADMVEDGKMPQPEALKEFLGHTPIEVFAGALLGFLMATFI